MDILDRIAAVLRAIFGETGATGRPGGPDQEAGASQRSSGRPFDPDLAAAWEELNDYLGEERTEGGSTGSRTGPRAETRGTARASTPPESLRPDYANLEVPFGADLETVRRSYKRLVLHYHPDRQGGDPEKTRIATEISKKVNQSFERIRSFQEQTDPGRR